MKKRLLSIALTLAMVMTMIPTTAFAQETSDEKPRVYVSIGDSMTNGYGLDGYDGESGIMNYGKDVYANQFAAWLAGCETDEDGKYTIQDDQTVFTGTNGTVDHRQLAMSGMRSEDLAWLLQLDYKNMTDAKIKNVARFRYAVNSSTEPWQTDLEDNICTGIVDGRVCNCGRIHGWQSEWGNGREYWYSYDVRTDTVEKTGLNFASGDWRTWTDLLNPSYRLADGVVKVLSMYGKEGFGFKTDVALANNVQDLATAKFNNSDWLGDNQWSSSNIDQLFKNAEGQWLEFAAEFYQESVADADVITLALGNTNFGTFMFDSIKEIFFNPNTPSGFPSRYHIDEVYLMAKRAGIDDELMGMIKDLINNEIDPMMNEQFEDIANQPLPTSANYVTDPYDLLKNYGGQTKGALIKYIVEYCVLSYVVGYIASMERIVELNPDVKLIQVALMNSYKTENSTAEEKDGASFADIIDMLYGPMNAFVAMMPEYLASKHPGKYDEATFYYAECGTVETLSAVYGDDFYTYDNKSITYDEYQAMLANDSLDVEKLGHNTSSTVRSRFHKWIAGADGCKHDCSGGDQLSEYGAHAYISDCYLCMEIMHNPNDSSYGWGKFEYAELLKYILGPMECPYPDDTISPTQKEIDKYKAGWTDFNKFFNKYRIVMVSEADVREYEKMTTEAKNAMLLSGESFDSYTTQKGRNVPYRFAGKNGFPGGTTAAVRKADWAFSCAMYLALEEATIMAGNQEFMMSDLAGVQGFTPATFKGVAAQFAKEMGQPVFGAGSELTTVNADVIRENFRDALLADGPTATLLCLANRMQIGSGIGGHPSEGGHDAMFEAIKEVYEEGYTSQEQIKNIFLGYLNTEYPELMEAIGAAGAMGDMDDLAIIMAMLKLSQATGGNPALENVDLDKLEGEIREVLRMYEEDLTIEEQIYALELANDVMDRTQNLASKATYSKYEPDEKSFYVSLGDSNVTGYGLDGYVSDSNMGVGQIVPGAAPVMLAKELYGDDWESRFAQYAQGALRSEDMLRILGVEGVAEDSYWDTEVARYLLKGNIEDTSKAYIEALENADLISVAIGGGNVTTFVGRQVDLVLAGKDPVEMDWEKIGFGYPALLQLDELLEVLVPLMDKMGLLNKYLPEAMKDVKNPAAFARVLAESLLYGYASYNYYYPQVLARIREINHDAQILILGMFNPVDEWELNMEIEGKEVVIPIGGVISNVLESANLQNLAYALQNENTTFVDLSDNYTFLDARIDNEGFEPTFADYYKEILKGNGKEVHANEDGHVYMFNQMYAALQDDYMDDMVSVAIEFFKPLAEKYGQDVYEYIINNPYKVAAFIDEYSDEMMDLAKEYYDEAYAYAYIYADKKGYIDNAADVLDEVLAAVDSVDVAGLDIPESVKDELENAIAIVKQDIANLKAALENDEFDTVENLLANGGALLGGLYSDLRALDRLAESAGIDLFYDAIAIFEAEMEEMLEGIEKMKACFIEKLEELLADAEDGVWEEIGKLEDISLSGLKKLIAELEEQIAVINAQLETLQGYTGTEVTKLIEELQTELDEAEAYLDKLTALTEKVEDLVNEIENEPELTTEKVQAIVADAKSIVADTENLVAEAQAAMVELAAVYEAVMPQLIEALQSVEGPVGEALDVTAEEIEKFAAELTAGCEKTVAAVNAAADEIDGVVAETIAAVSDSVAEAVAAIEEATIEAYDEIAPAVEDAIEEIEAQASALAQSADAEIRDAAQAILDELEKLDVDTVAYEEKLAEASEIVAALMDEAAQIETAVQAVAFQERAETALGELAAIAEEIYALAETDVPATLSDIGLAAKNILETVDGSAVSLGAAASGAAAASAQAILDAVNTVVPAAKKAVGAYEAAVNAAAGEIAEAVTAAAEEISAEAVVVLDTAVEAVESIVAQGTSGAESVVEAWSKVFYDATHGELDVDCKTSYVALGSSVAYAEELAELLGAYITLSTDEADLAEADLVTIGVDTDDMVADIEGKIVYMVAEFIKSEPQIAKLLSNENLKSGIESYLNSELDLDLDLDAVLEAPEKEVDWSQYPAVDADALAAVLAEVESALVKNDVPEIYTLDIGEIISPKLSEELGMEITVNCVVEIPVAALVMEAAEYVLYAYAGYAAEYDDIYNMVPESAQVVLTGTYQSEEIQEIAGISIGEYVGYAFAAMDVQPLVYALVNDNTTFVSVQETNGDAEEMAEAVYAALDVTEIGHEWDDVVTDPTCTEDGYTTYICLKCGETYIDDVTDSIGHAWGEWTDNGDGTHSRVCANDASHVETNDHDFTDGDCVCGAKKPAEDDDEPSGGGGGSSRDWHCPYCKSNTCHSKAFSDLDLKAWYHKYTDYVLCKGLMKGMGGDIFAPNATTTRAMIITTLYRMEGSPAVSGEIAYTDVAEGTWYTDAVIWGTQNGIVKGYENATFDPVGSVTREQIAAIFNRYATYKKVDTKKAAASLDAYVDAAQVSAWAVEDMKWAVGNKFIVGRTDTTLVPNGATTRAEMATLLYRWANEIAK